MTLRELRAARAAALDASEALLAQARAESRDLSEAETADFDRHAAELRRIDRELALAERRAEIDRDAPARPAGGARADAEAEFRSILRGETRAMSGASGADGGYAIPTEIDSVIRDLLRAASPMRRLATVVSTTTSDYQIAVARTGARSGWAGEATTRGETDTPTLGIVRPASGELYARPSVSNWLIDDFLGDLESFLARDVVAEMAAQESAAFVLGDGISKPLGFLSNPTSDAADAARPFGTIQTVASGAADGLGAFTTARTPIDPLLDLVAALPAAYRAGPGVAWLMSSSTASALRKITGPDGRSLWVESLTEGAAARLLGFAVEIDETMPAIEAGATPIAFGNWRRGYTITDRVGTRVIRDEITKPGWTSWYFAKRVGGAVIDSNAIKLLRIGEA